MKRINNIISIIVFSFICFIISISFSSKVSAEEVIPTIYLDMNREEVNKNSSYTGYIYGNNIESLSSLQIEIYYNEEDINITSVTNYMSTSLFDYKINEDNTKMSFISSSGVKIETSTILASFRYTVLETANDDSITLDLVIAEALSSTLEVIDVEGNIVNLDIAVEEEQPKSLRIYSNISKQNAEYGDLITVSYYSYYFNSISNGSFVIAYDKNYFELVEFKTLGYFNDDMLVDINTTQDGYVYLSYITTKQSSNSQLFTITLKVVGNETTTSEISLTPTSLYGFENETYNPNIVKNSVSLVYSSIVAGHHHMYLTGNEDINTQTYELTANIEKESNLGAGDFTIEFPVNYLKYDSYEIAFDKTMNQYIIVNDNKVNQGIIKFSIISTEDIVTRTSLIRMKFSVIDVFEEKDITFTISGSNTTDSLTNSITLSYSGLDTKLSQNKFNIDVEENQNGSVQVKSNEYSNQMVSIVVTPYIGYQVESVYYIANEITVPILNNQFMMPASDVKIYVTYTLIDYVITFISEGSVLSSETYHYGDTVVIPNNPTKQSDNTYRYEFSGWDKEVTTVTDSATYTAQYNPVYIEYTIIFKNYDNTVLSSETYHYGDTVVVPDNPSRESTLEYDYSFVGWNKEVTNVTKSDEYVARYNSVLRKYTIKWIIDGTIVETDNDVLYNDLHEYNGQAPTRASDNTYTYEFSEWNQEVIASDNLITYTARFTNTYIDYTIVFKNYNDTVLSSKTYHYGDEIVVPDDPIKPKDKKYTYEFTGWDKEITTVTGNTTYTAVFDSKEIENNTPIIIISIVGGLSVISLSIGAFIYLKKRKLIK